MEEGVPGVYKICVKVDGKLKYYVGKSIDIYKRLKKHVYLKHWTWSDIQRIFVQVEKDAPKRSVLERETVLDTTAGLRPKDVDNVLNKQLPSGNAP